jgi:hypothetical protein
MIPLVIEGIANHFVEITQGLASLHLNATPETSSMLKGDFKPVNLPHQLFHA